MKTFLLKGGGNPGRSGHGRSIGAVRIVVETRELLARLFNVNDCSRIVFTKNATEALNMAIHGLALERGHIVTSSMEHNSVMRPLTYLKTRGIGVSVVQADAAGRVSAQDVARAMVKDTCLVILTHASNVTGAVNDIGAVGTVCRERGVPFLVDAAQSAGSIPIDVQGMHIDYLAFSGHKGLMGPQGTGGLYIGDDRMQGPLMRGGTGSLSDSEEQPDFFPDRYESGTLNVVGIAGLAAGVKYVLDKGVEAIRAHDASLMGLLLEELCGDSRYSLYGPCVATVNANERQPQQRSLQRPLQRGRIEQTAVLSLNITDQSPSMVGQLLERDYGVQTRIGLHCAPSAHRSIGTFPEGTVRLSWGPFTSAGDVKSVIRALHCIAGGNKP
jgi:selenocysteine lyase/cysteine desulfurase